LNLISELAVVPSLIIIANDIFGSFVKWITSRMLKSKTVAPAQVVNGAVANAIGVVVPFPKLFKL